MGVKREGNAVEEGVEKQGVVRGAGADRGVGDGDCEN